jgi:hypothetical protein
MTAKVTKGNRATIERTPDQIRNHASAARPFKANSPRGASE